MKEIKLRNFSISNNKPLTLMGGVNVLESEEMVMRVAEKFKNTCDKLNINWIFKGSYDKANRSSLGGKRGVGMEQTLTDFATIKQKIKRAWIKYYRKNECTQFWIIFENIKDALSYVDAIAIASAFHYGSYKDFNNEESQRKEGNFSFLDSKNIFNKVRTFSIKELKVNLFSRL